WACLVGSRGVGWGLGGMWGGVGPWLPGAGHYHLHRKWKRTRGARFTMPPIGKALFDINYVGTSLIGTDGHVLLHHPYLGSGADVKKTFFDGMLRLHPVLRVPGYTLHKLRIALT